VFLPLAAIADFLPLLSRRFAGAPVNVESKLALVSHHVLSANIWAFHLSYKSLGLFLFGGVTIANKTVMTQK
jgi:hypothetical protein